MGEQKNHEWVHILCDDLNDCEWLCDWKKLIGIMWMTKFLE